VVQAWFQGMNPQLDDAGPQVLAAARAFAAAG
jgi:hypothetical protein